MACVMKNMNEISEQNPLGCQSKAISGAYPFEGAPERGPIVTELLTGFPENFEGQPEDAVEFTAPKILVAKYADLPNAKDIQNWNTYDPVKGVLRRSFTGPYRFDPKTHCPLNPWGNTGIWGRGVLGLWGPNHAADPVVTRWKRNADRSLYIDPETGKKVLEGVLIQRPNGEWAIPGGMCESGDCVNKTMRKEFEEEACGFIEATSEEKLRISESTNSLFSKGGVLIYEGPVNDPRNTNNAWMETTVRNFHDDDDTSVGRFVLKAGDDAKAVRWQVLSRGMKLFASHAVFISQVLDLHQL